MSVSLSIAPPTRVERGLGRVRSYNGFSPAERYAIGPCLQERRRLGIVWHRPVCDACGGTDDVSGHSEDYSTPHGPHIGAYTLCRVCHYAVHTRHRNATNWSRKRESARAHRGGRTTLDDIDEGLRYPSTEALTLAFVVDPFVVSRATESRLQVRHASLRTT